MARRQSQHPGVRGFLFGFEPDPNDDPAANTRERAVTVLSPGENRPMSPARKPIVIPYTNRGTSKGETFHTPFAQVRILAPSGESLVGPAQLDTGCERTHIPRDVAERAP